MEIRDFMEAAETYLSLGYAATSQMEDLLNRNFDFDSLNENAVSEITRFANKLDNDHGVDVNDLHEAIDEYESLTEEDEIGN